MASAGAKALAALGTVGGGSAATGLVLTYDSGSGEFVTTPLLDDKETNRRNKNTDFQSSDLSERETNAQLTEINVDEGWSPLSQISEYGSQTSNTSVQTTEWNKNSQIFAIFLRNSKLEQEQWKNSFEVLTKDKQANKQPSDIHQSFADLTDAFSEENNKSLNKHCQSIYDKKFDDTFYYEENISGGNKVTKMYWNLFNNFWKYCSYLEKPLDLIDARRAGTEIDGPDFIDYTYWIYLLSPKPGRNERFWKIKQKWYNSLSKENLPYKQDFEQYINKRPELKKTPFSLQEFCNKAVLEKTSGEQIKIVTALKYCSYWDYRFHNWFNEDGFTRKNSQH